MKEYIKWEQELYDKIPEYVQRVMMLRRETDVVHTALECDLADVIKIAHAHKLERKLSHLDFIVSKTVVKLFVEYLEDVESTIFLSINSLKKIKNNT